MTEKFLNPVCSDLGKMLSHLLGPGENALTLAQTWGKCSHTCSELGKMLSDLLRLGENALRLAQTWGDCCSSA